MIIFPILYFNFCSNIRNFKKRVFAHFCRISPLLVLRFWNSPYTENVYKYLRKYDLRAMTTFKNYLIFAAKKSGKYKFQGWRLNSKGSRWALINTSWLSKIFDKLEELLERKQKYIYIHKRLYNFYFPCPSERQITG